MANLGDSKAVLLRESQEGAESKVLEAVNVSTTYSANKQYEKDRLKKEFKGERDIVHCRNGDPRDCFVKGGVMPTRTIGDLRLKDRDFNFHEFDRERGYWSSIPYFTGPYVKSEPDIQVINLTSADKYLILASDGLWNEITRRTSAKVATKIMKNTPDLYKNDGKKFGQTLLKTLCENALENAANQRGLTLKQVNQIRSGDFRKKVHDDMTVLIVNLDN